MLVVHEVAPSVVAAIFYVLRVNAMRKLKKYCKLDEQEETDEINALRIIVTVEIDGKTE